jgi:hypothetical protein
MKMLIQLHLMHLYLNFVKNTVAVNNPSPAAGARTADTLQDIKNNALANFATQARSYGNTRRLYYTCILNAG